MKYTNERIDIHNVALFSTQMSYSGNVAKYSCTLEEARGRSKCGSATCIFFGDGKWELRLEVKGQVFSLKKSVEILLGDKKIKYLNIEDNILLDCNGETILFTKPSFRIKDVFTAKNHKGIIYFKGETYFFNAQRICQGEDVKNFLRQMISLLSSLLMLKKAKYIQVNADIVVPANTFPVEYEFPIFIGILLYRFIIDARDFHN
jgi:hypothetical protein